MSRFLSDLGWTVYSLDLIPANGDAELNVLAEQLSKFIDQNVPAGQPFDLVGFSMGGLVSRYYVQRMGGINRVQRFITLSSPHNGTIAAYGSTRPGCLQMRPNSDFLNDLNRDLPMLEQLNFTSIWTSLDLIILPAKSSELSVGTNIQISVPLHPWMVRDRRVIREIVARLKMPVSDRQSYPTRDRQK
jgi:triacylglycerol lipase